MVKSDTSDERGRPDTVTAVCAGSPSRNRIARNQLAAGLVLLALLLAGYACSRYATLKAFQNPVAYTMVGSRLFVFEKQGNTLLELEYSPSREQLDLKGRYAIEPDDANYYYMVRHLYRGPKGVVVQSYIYTRSSNEFVGYRFREYASFQHPPREILTVLLESPRSFPEIQYAHDASGAHYFANNCAGHKNLWRIAPEGNVFLEPGKKSTGVEEFGEWNETLSNWISIAVGPEGQIFVLSGTTGHIVEYTPQGERLGVIGTTGFEPGMLLAPGSLFLASLNPSEPERPTVSSTGNRTWVQFDATGNVLQTLSPLQQGYPFPDLLTGVVYTDSASGAICSFDLANRSFILHSLGFKAIGTYRDTQPGVAGLFGGLTLLVLLLAAFFSRKKTWLDERLRFPFFLKLLLVFVPLIVLSALVVGNGVKDVLKADLEAESVRRSENLARAVLNSLSETDLDAIQQPQDRESESYERVYTTLNRLVDQSVEYTPKWILHKIHNGKFYFGINIWRGPLFAPFIVTADRSLFLDAVKSKETRTGRYRDDQGEWFSTLSPIVNPAGEVTYVLELYRPTEAMDRSARAAGRHIVQITLGTALVAVLLAFLFSFLFTRPLQKLMRGSRIVSTGDFDHRIEIATRDEMGALAGAFNAMVEDLKTYTAHLAETTAAKERIESELRLAREVQQAILPKVFPPFPEALDIEIYASMEPAKEVGGDYYDFFLIDGEHMGAVVADVSGKGVPAGLFMMVVRALLRNNAMNNLSPAAAVSNLNRLIASDNPSSMFVTLIYLICNMTTGEVTYCNAGHPFPIRISRGKAELLRPPPGRRAGMVVGAVEDVEYTDAQLVLGEGESIVLYTDGVTEPIDSQNEMFGEARLLETLEAHSHLANRELCTTLFERVRSHQQGVEPFDDITILFFKYLGSSGQPR